MKIKTIFRTILRTILDISILCIIGICLFAIVVLSGNPKNQLSCALLVGLCFSMVYILCGAVEHLKWWGNWADHLQISESTISRNLTKLKNLEAIDFIRHSTVDSTLAWFCSQMIKILIQTFLFSTYVKNVGQLLLRKLDNDISFQIKLIHQ